MHDLLLEHPELVEIAAKQHVAGEAAYRGAEVVLDALRRAGIDGEAAASAFATLVAYTLGFVQQQLHTSTRGTGLADRQRCSSASRSTTSRTSAGSAACSSCATPTDTSTTGST